MRWSGVIVAGMYVAGCAVPAVLLDAERGASDPTDTGDTADTANTGDTGDTWWVPLDTDTGSAPFVWVSLTWTHAGDDLDLHLLAPGGVFETETDCYYANCVDWGYGSDTIDWGILGDASDDPRLDLDDIPGTGPENIDIEVPADGIYTVLVNDYPGSVYAEPNTFFVTVHLGDVIVASFVGEATTEDAYVEVATISIPDGTVTGPSGTPPLRPARIGPRPPKP